MKRATILKLTMLCYSLFLTFHVERADAQDYRVGTYNIRCITSESAESRNWANRKEYVAKIIIDQQFDVLGIQEISGDDQEGDLRKLLPDYTMVVWGRESAEESAGERLAVAFRTAAFKLLDSGHFFLTPNPELPGIGWDASHKRVSVWAKLQDIRTDRIFFYCSTHLDNSGIVARREGARVNTEMINKLSEGYPVFVVGDFNAKANEKGVHYTMGAYLDDSRLTSGIELTGPEGTLSGWDPNRSNTTRIDYVYSRSVEIKRYEVITEDYGRGVTPSDHFCVVVSAQLKQPSSPQNRYVSTEGDDANDGSIQSPFKSIYKALSVAQSFDTLRVAEGTYFTGTEEGLSRNTYLKVQRTLTIIGGYNNHFNEIVGYSTLDGDFSRNDVFDEAGKVVSGNTDNSKWLLYAYKPYLLQLENFKICNAYLDDATSTKGAGVYSAGYGLKLKNVVFTNNYSTASGGALKTTGKLEMDSCVFKNNSAIGGGAIYLKNDCWATRILNSHFESNAAETGSALFIDKNADMYAYGNSFVNNNSLKQGSISVLGNTVNSQFTFINNTFANNKLVFSGEMSDDLPGGSDLFGGSAIYFSPGTDGKIALVNNTITGNVSEDSQKRASFKGAAVQLVGGSAFLYNNIIAGNYSTSGIGDVYYEKENMVYCMGKNNVYTSADNANIKFFSTDIMAANYATGISQLEKTLNGAVSDSRFEAYAKNNGGCTYTVDVVNPLYGITSINNLAKRDLNEFYMTFVDLDGGTDMFTILGEDQIGRSRDMSGHSTIGAYEYTGSGDVGVNNISSESIRMYYSHGTIFISGNLAEYYTICHVDGKIVKSGRIENNRIAVDDISQGIYLCVIKSKDGDSICKFVR